MKCLRCGAELKNSTLFCSQCSKVTAAPLEESPYMSKRILLPKRTSPLQHPKKQEGGKPVKKERPAGRWILLSTLLLLLSAALLFQWARTYREKEARETELARLQAVEDECVRLTDMLRQAEQEAAALEKELEGLGSSAYLALREDLKAVREEKEALSAELARTQTSLRTLEEQMGTLEQKTDFFDTHIVFLQEDDTNIFHSYDCEKFTRHGYRAYNKQQALSLGYTPCPQCQ